MRVLSTYEVYCQLQIARGQPAPTREWWIAACAARRELEHRDADQREIDRERAEGWARGE